MSDRRRRATRRALAELAWLRRGAYRLFASVFLYPEAQRLTELPQAAAEFRQYDSLLARLAFFAPWRRLLEALAELAATAAGGREELESEYVRLFVVGSRNVRCPLYESYYLEPGGQISGLVEAQLEREYLAGGVVVGRGLGEAPDHLAVELEFMAHLCNQEADAWEEAAAGRISIRPYSRWRSPEVLPAAGAVEALDRERAFLGRHLSVWLPALCPRVTDATREELYRAAALATTAFVHHDRDLASLLCSELQAESRAAPVEASNQAQRAKPALSAVEGCKVQSEDTCVTRLGFRLAGSGP